MPEYDGQFQRQFMITQTITIEDINSLYCSLECDDYDTRAEISSHFTYQYPNYEHTPAHKRGGWDGMISVYEPNSDVFFAGSVNELKNLCDRNGWMLIDNRAPKGYSLTDEEAKDFYDSLNLDNFEVREHQDKAFRSIISDDGNGFYISPTSSGKSFIAFMVARFIHEMTEGKTLIVVPSTHLVGQMTNDFKSYTTDDIEVKKIMAGVDKDNITEKYVVTTWQSIVNMEPEWFDQFECFIGDEGHGFTAASLKTILSKTGNIPIKCAMTGSLRGCPVARMQLEAFFGSITVVTTYKELLAKGYISELAINVMLFKHDKKRVYGRKFGSGAAGYKAELGWLAQHEGRNEFICEMPFKLKGNTMIMVKDLEHGEILRKIIQRKTNRPIQFINGKVKSDIRLDAMDEMENTESGMIIIATYKSFGTGTSIKNLHHLIFADMLKSDETVIQTLGRLLRLHESKDKATLWDLADDLRVKSNSIKNFSLNHLAARCEVYDDIEYDYKIYERPL